MVSLESGFERSLKEALLDDVERQLTGTRGNLIFETIQRSHEILEQYGQEHDYDVQGVIESLQQPEVVRSGSTVSVRWGWDHPAAPFFQLGTSDHTIQGNPVLSFVWEDPPQWVRKEFEQARGGGGQFESGWRVFFAEVDVQGLPASRFVREALRWLRRELEA